jgi:hypothetical protein
MLHHLVDQIEYKIHLGYETFDFEAKRREKGFDD